MYWIRCTGGNPEHRPENSIWYTIAHVLIAFNSLTMRIDNAEFISHHMFKSLKAIVDIGVFG